MNRFDYVRPATVSEAVAAAAVPGSAYLAAGTNLLDLMKGGVISPQRLIDVSRLPGLDQIQALPDGAVRIGAGVRNADLANDITFRGCFPAVAEALLSGASAQLRNAATVGGNLLQRTRCAYFYDTASACNKRHAGAGCDARGGENRLHAVLGWSDSCIATHPSDFCVPLAALDAVVEIEGQAGRREVPLEEFHLLPGGTPERESVLEPGELVVAVRLPGAATQFAAHARYLKLRERTSYAFAVVSAAACLRIVDGGIAEARLALGGVAAKRWRARAAEAALAGAPPRGRVTFLDVSAARALSGVVEVMTQANRPPLALDPDAKTNPFMFRLDLLQNDRVRYAGQPIAVVIAETLEAATEGAALLSPRYDAEPANVGLDDSPTFVPPVIGPGYPSEVHHGDVEVGLAAARHRIEAVYETQAQYHNAMEPHAIVAEWDGDRLTVDTPSQGLAWAQERIAGLLGIPLENIHIRSPFLGGGFGSKGLISGPQVLGTLSARLVGRPVKLVLRRDQMYGPVGHRAPTRQTLRLGADPQGALTAIHHHMRAATSSFDDFFEPAVQVSHALYACPAIATTAEAVRLDTGTPLFMRAPGEAPGSIALESAVDEMALAVGMDPLDFRQRNYAEVEPISGKLFSSKALRECYAQGAARFGWAGRPLAPRQMRDENGLLVGWGLGTAIFPAIMFQGQARAVLRRDGTGLVELGAHDMGQGAWTALAQIAADSLGVELEQLEFRAGSSDLPDAGIAGGSAHTATAGMAIHGAGADAISKLAELAMGDDRSPLFGAGNAGVAARGGRLFRRDDESRSEGYADILTRAGLTEIEGRGSGGADPAAQNAWSVHAHGAVFAEVKVDPESGQIRATRLVGAFAAGTIINPRLVQSQYYGGMIWGLSFALHEQAVLDQRSGRVMNANLAVYHVPVNADVPSLEAILVEEHDPHVNALGIKGVGEIGITGTAGAIANAVWHATGVRVRRFPITVEQLIGG